MNNNTLHLVATNIAHIFRSLVGLITVLATVLLIHQILINYIYLTQQQLKNKAIYECGLVSQTASSSAALAANTKDFYKTCIEDKGYNSNLK